MNTELLEVSEWLTVNKLTLNIKKSNYVIFNPNINGVYSAPPFKSKILLLKT